MKKKAKPKKKEDMPEFAFKEFTDEESRIYDEAVSKFREMIDAGRKLKEAYAAYPIADSGLQSLVQADFLKILIAERHFAKHETLESLAASLDIPLDLVKNTLARMLQEVGITAANQYEQQVREVHRDEVQMND